MDVIKSEYVYFIKIYEVLNISRAAEELGIQQAGLSKALKLLERNSKSKLFYRTNRGLIPTDSAKILYSKLCTLEETWSQYDDLNIHGKINISSHPLLAQKYLPNFINQSTIRFPNLFINFKFSPSTQVTRDILNFETDIGIVVNPPKHNDLVIHKLAKERIILWGHGNDKVIYYNPEMIGIAKTLKSFKEMKHIPIADYHVLANIVRFTKGYVLAPSSLPIKDRVPFQEVAPVDVALIYHYEREKSKAFVESIKLIKESV